MDLSYRSVLVWESDSILICEVFSRELERCPKYKIEFLPTTEDFKDFWIFEGKTSRIQIKSDSQTLWNSKYNTLGTYKNLIEPNNDIQTFW